MIVRFKDHTVVPGNDDIFPVKDSFKEISYDQLTELYNDEDYIPYAEYLRSNLWHVRRLEILDRDKFKCRNCGAHETEVIKNSDNEDILYWYAPIEISWQDLKGNERLSSFVVPEGSPDRPYNLHIHHKKYIRNRLPWDYDDDDLITLCNYCHKEAHQNNVVPIFDDNGNQIVYKNCDRCGGVGYFRVYKHVEGGRCFKCHGKRFNILLINKKM